ncbi:hypothetical protein LAU42_08980 [Macrococcus armenti]|uniref:hypothetical protein n=1 Tax=Macrococcus armenti TaxID=2875764 RepID=UPI001CCB3C98|nr:hypothetical protein [Macrococcus armenti]UBH21900.1 hypothetical protein LAU42_08980 [Macrococcus armenti]
MIRFVTNAIMTLIVVLLLAAKVAVVTDVAPNWLFYVDNYITVYIIFAILDVLNFLYSVWNTTGGDEV